VTVSAANGEMVRQMAGSAYQLGLQRAATFGCSMRPTPKGWNFRCQNTCPYTLPSTTQPLSKPTSSKTRARPRVHRGFSNRNVVADSLGADWRRTARPLTCARGFPRSHRENSKHQCRTGPDRGVATDGLANRRPAPVMASRCANPSPSCQVHAAEIEKMVFPAAVIEVAIVITEIGHSRPSAVGGHRRIRRFLGDDVDDPAMAPSP